MKKTLVGLFVMAFVVTNAQDTTKTLGQDIKSGVKATGKAIKKGAKAVGTKTSEIASKGQSKVVDKVYKGKSGPNGETIYITNESKYYWIDKKGHRKYVTESELKDS